MFDAVMHSNVLSNIMIGAMVPYLFLIKFNVQRNAIYIYMHIICVLGRESSKNIIL